MLSWSLYDVRHQVIEQGDYKVWRFNDILQNPEINEVEDAYDVLYIKDVLQQTIQRHQPRVIGHTPKEWEDFCKYASWNPKIKNIMFLGDQFMASHKFKQNATQSIDANYQKFGGSAHPKTKPSEKLNFLKSKLDDLEPKINSKDWVAVDPRYKAVDHAFSYQSSQPIAPKKELEQNLSVFSWWKFILGVVLFVVGTALLYDGQKEQIPWAVGAILLGTGVFFHNIFKKA